MSDAAPSSPAPRPSPTPEYMDVAEFRAKGYLQELNRQFLHPLGLALSIAVQKDGTETLAQIWDSREDPEGYVYVAEFTQTEEFRARAAYIAQQRDRYAPVREQKFGYIVQPVGALAPTTEAEDG